MAPSLFVHGVEEREESMAGGKVMEASTVVWVDAMGMAYDNTVIQKLQRLIYESSALGDLSEGMRVGLKVNIAEEGYEYGLRPVFLRIVADMVGKATKTRPIVCDGLKLVDYWKQAKGNAFLEVARFKGYSNDTLGGHFVINGGFSGDEGNLYSLNEANSVLGGVDWIARYHWKIVRFQPQLHGAPRPCRKPSAGSERARHRACTIPSSFGDCGLQRQSDGRSVVDHRQLRFSYFSA